jgi:hypothetical protein
MSRSRCGPKNARNWSSSNPARSPKAVRRCKQGRSSGRGTPIPVVVFDTCGRRWMRHCDLAARLAPEVMRHRCPRESRGRRESRVPVTPTVVRKKCTRRTAGAPERPAFPARWFYGLCRALPGAEFLWPPSPANWWLASPGWALTNLRRLDTSNGCQDHTVLPSAASLNIRLDRPACCRKKFQPRRLSAVRLRAVRSLTG